MEDYNLFDEYLKLIAQYDWAVEGFNPPEDTKITREQAVELRNKLVKLAGERNS